MFFGGFGFHNMHEQRRRPQREHHTHRQHHQENAAPQSKFMTTLLQLLPVILIILSISGSLFHTVSLVSDCRSPNTLSLSPTAIPSKEQLQVSKYHTSSLRISSLSLCRRSGRYASLNDEVRACHRARVCVLLEV